jgi:hypothetical protein
MYRPDQFSSTLPRELTSTVREAAFRRAAAANPEKPAAARKLELSRGVGNSQN